MDLQTKNQLAQLQMEQDWESDDLTPKSTIQPVVSMSPSIHISTTFEYHI
jgi:hypothetical protein